MRTFSCDSDARCCAPVEVDTLPGRLRRWTDHTPKSRATTAIRECPPNNLTAPTATPQETEYAYVEADAAEQA